MKTLKLWAFLQKRQTLTK